MRGQLLLLAAAVQSLFGSGTLSELAFTTTMLGPRPAYHDLLSSEFRIGPSRDGRRALRASMGKAT